MELCVACGIPVRLDELFMFVHKARWNGMHLVYENSGFVRVAHLICPDPEDDRD